MTRDEIVRLVIWTMEYYGSNAGEKNKPGSKLRSQAEHIAAVIEELAEADRLMQAANLRNVRATIFPSNAVDLAEYPLSD